MEKRRNLKGETENREEEYPKWEIKVESFVVPPSSRI